MKTVLFITHRLSVARRADKIAMMEHGVCQISHFDHAVPMLILGVWHVLVYYRVWHPR